MIEWYYFIAGFICGILLWQRKYVVRFINAFSETKKTSSKKLTKAEKKKLLKQLLEED